MHHHVLNQHLVACLLVVGVVAVVEAMLEMQEATHRPHPVSQLHLKHLTV
jgi:hypothetical protein